MQDMTPWQVLLNSSGSALSDNSQMIAAQQTITLTPFTTYVLLNEVKEIETREQEQ